MCETAALLVDHRLPAVAYRQWVLSFPGPLAVRLGYDKELLGQVCRSFTNRVMQALRRQVKREHGLSSSRVLHPGVLCVVQRFRNDLGLFVHLHCLVTDGCFEEVAEDRPRFLPTRGLTEDLLVRVLAAVHRDLAAALDEPATEPDAPPFGCSLACLHPAVGSSSPTARLRRVGRRDQPRRFSWIKVPIRPSRQDTGTFLIRKIREAAAAASAVEVTQGEESTELGSEAKPTILTGPLGPITVRTSKAKKTAQAKKPRKPRKAPIRVAQVEAPQVADAPAPEVTVSDTSTAETSVLDIPAPLNLKTLSVDDLRKAYVEEVGRPTKSTDRNYLIWKIRMARKGKVPVGPIHRTRSENHGALKVLPLRMPEATVEALDDVWRRHSLSSRMEMFRCALHQYLTSLEEHEAASLIQG